jgi:hypothetical protein
MMGVHCFPKHKKRGELGQSIDPKVLPVMKPPYILLCTQTTTICSVHHTLSFVILPSFVLALLVVRKPSLFLALIFT